MGESFVIISGVVVGIEDAKMGFFEQFAFSITVICEGFVVV